MERNFSWWPGANTDKNNRQGDDYCKISGWCSCAPLPTSVARFSYYPKPCYAHSRSCMAICCKLAGRNVWPYCTMENRCDYFGNVIKQLLRYWKGVYLQTRKHPTPGSRCWYAFGQNIFFIESSWVSFLLWGWSEFLMSGEFSSKIRFWVTASIHSKLGFAIIAFDVCSLAFLPLLTPVAVNYPGRLPTTMETIASVPGIHGGRGCRLCWRLHQESREFPRLCSHWSLWFFFLQCMFTIIDWGGNSISDLHWIPGCLCCGHGDS